MAETASTGRERIKTGALVIITYASSALLEYIIESSS